LSPSPTHTTINISIYIHIIYIYLYICTRDRYSSTPREYNRVGEEERGRDLEGQLGKLEELMGLCVDLPRETLTAHRIDHH